MLAACFGRTEIISFVTRGLDPAMTPNGINPTESLARIPIVGYDFGKKNTNAEKGELT
jgi:hypothetical protein